ncbi:MAG: hypothetical protein LBL15_04020, partial [Oscillospiraceae bacterium]|nr:hypothetical protein [Oscillospiraceae bacterium]
RNKFTRVLAALYAVLSAIALLIWLGFLFFALFLGGSPGPDYERSVPYLYVGIMTFGLLGAVLGLTAGIKGSGTKPPPRVLSLCAALSGAAGSIPFFLMELPAVGLFALLLSILPTLLYLLLAPKKSRD